MLLDNPHDKKEKKTRPLHWSPSQASIRVYTPGLLEGDAGEEESNTERSKKSMKTGTLIPSFSYYKVSTERLLHSKFLICKSLSSFLL